jgi:glycosyltransferase involved in cell wall biosynthesis
MDSAPRFGMMPAVKLAVEVTTCTADRAGVGYYAEHLADALIASAGPGDEVVLIGNRAVAPELADRWAGRLHVSGGCHRYLWMQRDAPRLLESTGADLALFPNYLAPLASPCPYVTVVHDLAIYRTPQFFRLAKRAVLGRLLPIVTRGAAAVATVSEASRADVRDLLGVPEDRILMLPGAPHPACRPADPAAIAAIRARHGLCRPYILTVGTLEPRKNLPLLLRAFDRLLAQPDGQTACDLVVIGGEGWGDGPLRAELARRLPSGRVHVLGYVPQEALVALYGGAIAMAYPSHFEGFGLPVVEAMACGAPVVVTDVPALREAAGGAAGLVPPDDDAALADALRSLIADPGAREQARARGLQRAARLSWAAPAQRLWTFARQARGARTAPPRTAPPAPRGPAGADPRDWAIAMTVAYADVFDAAISVDELARGCLGARVDAAEVRRRAARRPLSDLLAVHDGGLVTRRGREALAARRADGIARTAALLHRHRRVIAGLASLPYVRMLALSGGTAHQNARGGDDIDLFVVTAVGRVFTAYTLLFLATRLTRTRGIVCPNYLVDEANLQIAFHHDLFTAHQALALVPVAGLPTFARFVDGNREWVQAHYPGYVPRPPASAAVATARAQRWAERALDAGGAALEQALGTVWRYRLGRRAARAHRADVVLSGGVLKMHLSDHRRRVLASFAQRLDDLHAAWPPAARAAVPAPASA